MWRELRTVFAVVNWLVGLVCLGYAFWLAESSSAPRGRTGAMAEFGVASFASAGGMCIVAAAVAVAGRAGPREPG